MRTGIFCVAIWALMNISEAGAHLLGNGQTSLAEPDRPIRMAHLVSPSHGWALAGDHLLWTDNDGVQWNDVTPPLDANKSIDGVFFLNAAHAWTVIHQADAYPSSIFVARTTHGGGAWTVDPLALDKNVDKDVRVGYGNSARLSFVDEAHGWMLLLQTTSSALSLSYIFETSDGGETWSRLPDPPIYGTMRFTSQQTGWLCGGILGDQLYVTRDAGHTWQRRILPVPPEAETAVTTQYHLPSRMHSTVPRPSYMTFPMRTTRTTGLGPNSHLHNVRWRGHLATEEH